MHNRPYRTGETWLSDDQLVLLDALFKGYKTAVRLLRRSSFNAQWALGYAHELDDTALKSNIRLLCEHGVLAIKHDCDETRLQITCEGGELWSRERCPVWERYCTDRYKTTLRGRTLMSVRAISPQMRDEFLDLCPQRPARCKTAVLGSCTLIHWRPATPIYVGVATYEEPCEWTPEEFTEWAEQERQHLTTVEQNRSWWRTIRELQRFVPHSE
jgi:hypothetical protein